MNEHYQKAFSLVELSIVLVILGLLTGGIITGRSMIRAAEMRNIASDMEKYEAAVYTFKEKYLGLPGDLNNAEAFWGEAHATPATCKITTSTGTATCNGNGDGRIYLYGSHSNEGFRFWQHLANAGIINGRYNGVAGSWDGQVIPDVNAPTTGGGSATILPEWQPKWTGDFNFFDGVYGNLFVVSNNGFGDWEAFSSVEVYGIDNKIDDGKPGLGKVRVRTQASMPNCSTSSDPSLAEYILTQETTSCYFQYIYDSSVTSW